MRIKPAPLPASFLAFAILGFLITAVLWNFDRIDSSWGFTFLLTFSMMFIASFISMEKAPVEAQLAMDEHHSKSKRR